MRQVSLASVRRYAAKKKRTQCIFTPRLWTSLAILSIPISGTAAVGNGHLTFHSLSHRLEPPLDESRLMRMGLVTLGRPFRADLAVSEIAFYKMKAIRVLRLETLDIKIIRSHAAAFTIEGGLSLGMI